MNLKFICGLLISALSMSVFAIEMSTVEDFKGKTYQDDSIVQEHSQNVTQIHEVCTVEIEGFGKATYTIDIGNEVKVALESSDGYKDTMENQKHFILQEDSLVVFTDKTGFGVDAYSFDLKSKKFSMGTVKDKVGYPIYHVDKALELYGNITKIPVDYIIEKLPMECN